MGLRGLGPPMVRAIEVGGHALFQCEVCDLGYAAEPTAKECEEFCRTYDACSIAITRLAVYRPGGNQGLHGVALESG